MTLTEQITDIREKLNVAAKEAAEKIKAGQDNPKINRLSPNAFTMSSSQLGASMNWSPFFHNWKDQYSFVAELINDGKFHDVKTILTNGKIKTPWDNRTFAPEVIAHISTIVGDLDFSAIDQDVAKKSIPTPRFR